MFGDQLAMSSAAIPFMTFKTVLGIVARIDLHHPVTHHFSNYRSRRHRERARITFFNGLLINGQGQRRDAVNQQVLRRDLESVHGPAHRLYRRLEDINIINLLSMGKANPNGKRLPANGTKQLFAFFFQ